MVGYGTGGIGDINDEFAIELVDGAKGDRIRPVHPTRALWIKVFIYLNDIVDDRRRLPTIANEWRRSSTIVRDAIRYFQSSETRRSPPCTNLRHAYGSGRAP